MTQENYTLYDGEQSVHLIADEGKVLVRAFDKFRFGKDIWLGYRYISKAGNPLKRPQLEVPEDFFEDDMTEEEIEMFNNIEL